MDQPDRDQGRMVLVREAYERSRRTYGYRRIQIWIKREYDIQINHKAVLRLMQKLNIRSIARKRRHFRQIQNLYGAVHTYPNLLGQNFKTQAPNEKWGTDITFVRTQQGFVYLAIIKDFFDGAILGYSVSRNYSIQMVLQAVQAAVSRFPAVKGIVLQSDQGFQYRSAAYQSLVSRYGIIPSMSRKGNCLDNAPTENFFSHLKAELLNHIQIEDFHEAVHIIDDYIHFFNVGVTLFL